MHLVSNPVVVFVLLTSDWIRTTHFAKAWISQSVPCKWACAMQRFSGRHPIEMRLHCCTNRFQSITMQWNIDNKDQPNPAGMSCSIRLKCRAGLDVLTALVVFTETLTWGTWKRLTEPSRCGKEDNGCQRVFINTNDDHCKNNKQSLHTAMSILWYEMQ